MDVLHWLLLRAASRHWWAFCLVAKRLRHWWCPEIYYVWQICPGLCQAPSVSFHQYKGSVFYLYYGEAVFPSFGDQLTFWNNSDSDTKRRFWLVFLFLEALEGTALWESFPHASVGLEAGKSHPGNYCICYWLQYSFVFNDMLLSRRNWTNPRWLQTGSSSSVLSLYSK